MLFCKVYSLELSSDKRTRLKLKGNDVGINDVCLELFDSLMKKYADHPFSSFHTYLSDELMGGSRGGLLGLQLPQTISNATSPAPCLAIAPTYRLRYQ